jgi:hypothetical protein
MHPALQKSFGGLPKPYCFRQFSFGLIFVVLFMVTAWRSANGISFGAALVLVLNALLYPYARFVYESIVGFIIGNNLFIVNAFAMMFVKLLTMALCFAAAVFIAPVGLIYLYVRNSRAG